MFVREKMRKKFRNDLQNEVDPSYKDRKKNVYQQ